MLRKFGLAAALALAAGFLQPPAGPEPSFPPASGPSEGREARLEPQSGKWAPNGMKVLIIHGKRRWVQKSGIVPIRKGEI